jgi:hypothetical protein
LLHCLYFSPRPHLLTEQRLLNTLRKWRTPTDAADKAAWDANMRAIQNPTTSNMMESWNREDAADAAQNMADNLADE